MNSHSVIHELSDRQFDELVDLYQGEWWSKGRTPSDVRKMLDSSCVVIAIEYADGRLAAFSRVLTDGVYWALIFDVIVHPDFRGEGLGQVLIDAILGHSAVCNVRSVALCCRPDMTEFYGKWGFAIEPPDVVWMRRRR
ncbi:MAG: GNAT family N-acetyltransferase [Planctomycetes bacterium]|nr:GNAT family N-acetyltransferase [Planctomycetota bacterium]MBI3835344.1 GNAT family N-acetyltransferase [Planctomycetota bacterium]